jgi:hypothetical protein
MVVDEKRRGVRLNPIFPKQKLRRVLKENRHSFCFPPAHLLLA